MAGDNAFTSALESNRQWSSTLTSKDSTYFPNLSKGQTPKLLWLGCSDSRIPETTLLGLQPGDVFTHRNIANIVHASDISLLSVVEFAVRHIKVDHVVLCGHTSCGGVAAALANGALGVLDIWLQPLRALREEHSAALAKLEAGEKGTELAKWNVRAGVEKLKRIPTVIQAMKERGVQVHGVLYDLATGELEEVECAEGEDKARGRVEAFETS